jgi:protein TonB
MPSSAPLRLVVSRADGPTLPASSPDTRPAPPKSTAPDRAVIAAAVASFAVHAAVLIWMAVHGVFGEERAQGAADDRLLIEGIPIEFIESAPVPEAPPTEAAAETEAMAEAEPPPEPIEDVAAPPPESAPVAEAEREVAVAPEPAPAPDRLLPPEAETGELAARPEEAQPLAPEEPPPEEPALSRPVEEEPPPPDPDTVPTPRAKPERSEVAEVSPPPEPAKEPENPKETAAAPAKPAAPPPSAPSAAQSAARSGGAGGGGAAETAGNAAASAYRAKVAAQLKRKRFYPNAARRDRLTGSTTVSFTLNASGKVTAVRVVRSSGKRILDEAAIEMVRRASPYPPIPPGLGNAITIQAPIAFDLPR